MDLQQINGETEEETKMQKKGSQFGTNSEEKQQREEARQKTIVAMAIADKKASVKGHCAFGKFVL